jgi:acetyltransferase-like isoleucine patch superfamily enzyme
MTVDVGRHTYGHESIEIRHWAEQATLTIGSFCSIADRVMVFLGSNHRFDWVTTYPFPAFAERWETARGIEGHPATNGNVRIGNHVWVGSGATIMSRVTVGDGAAIAADSVVTKDVESYAIVGGNPARLIRHRFAPEVVERPIGVAWWEWSDERIAAAIPLLCDGDIERFIDYGSGTATATARPFWRGDR